MIETVIENPSNVDLSVDSISAVVSDVAEFKGDMEEFPKSPIITISAANKPGEYYASSMRPLKIGKGSRLHVRVRLEPQEKPSAYLMKLRFKVQGKVLETEEFAIDL